MWFAVLLYGSPLVLFLLPAGFSLYYASRKSYFLVLNILYYFAIGYVLVFLTESKTCYLLTVGLVTIHLYRALRKKRPEKSGLSSTFQRSNMILQRAPSDGPRPEKTLTE